MPGFNDATCNCGKRIGWFGELKDCPPCPRCGEQISIEELEATERELEALRKELLADDSGPDGG